MVEFQEVMRQWNRMCESIEVHNRRKCQLVHAFDIPNCESCSDYALEDPAKTEEIVMSWAKEHPEPVYPTWGEWLAEQGELCKNWKDIRVISSAGNGVGGVIGWFYKNIPADIAEKLGIEPKEVQSCKSEFLR